MPISYRQDTSTHLTYRYELFGREPPPESLQERRDAETLFWLRDYFHLDVDLLQLYDEWSQKDAVFSKLRDRFSGIRMLRQDPFECLLS